MIRTVKSKRWPRNQDISRELPFSKQERSRRSKSGNHRERYRFRPYQIKPITKLPLSGKVAVAKIVQYTENVVHRALDFDSVRDLKEILKKTSMCLTRSTFDNGETLRTGLYEREGAIVPTFERAAKPLLGSIRHGCILTRWPSTDTSTTEPLPTYTSTLPSVPQIESTQRSIRNATPSLGMEPQIARESISHSTLTSSLPAGLHCNSCTSPTSSFGRVWINLRVTDNCYFSLRTE